MTSGSEGIMCLIRYGTASTGWIQSKIIGEFETVAQHTVLSWTTVSFKDESVRCISIEIVESSRRNSNCDSWKWDAQTCHILNP